MQTSIRFLAKFIILCFLTATEARATSQTWTSRSPKVKTFEIDLSKSVPGMLNLVKQVKLPDQPEYVGLGSSAGIDLAVLKQLQREWITTFNWKTEEASLNSYHHYTTDIEGLSIHFIHEKSSDPDAIPLILNHGWPGSFLEFLPLVKPLTTRTTTSTGKPVSFNIVIPSVPGFAFSSAPPANWTVADTARVFNTLMTDVLHYKTYAVHGTDWGSGVGYELYSSFNTSVRATHLTFLPFFPLRPDQLAAENITLSPLEEDEEQRFVDWAATGNGYFIEQTTKPNTIGLALQDSPVGQLAWIGEKFIEWSDPRAGTAPSLITHNEILRSVSLYYLTKSFLSSVFIYYQNPNGFRTTYTKATTDAPLLFSTFKYNAGFWPRALVEKVANVVQYHNHEFGGHFAGLDNPPALIEDLKEIGNFWG